MKLENMLKHGKKQEIWEKYCGFLDLSIDDFMQIQERLLLEQIDLLHKCKLGKKIMGEVKPRSMDEFRKLVPLTTYEDYAEILLNEQEDALPVKPSYWIQTTWKGGGGKEEIKKAPYPEELLEEHVRAFIACLLMSTSKKRGDFDLEPNGNFLYGMAPLPYLTGLVPYALKKEINFNYLPDIEQAERLGFRERNKVGFERALIEGSDFFFGLSAVLVKMGEDFTKKMSEKGAKDKEKGKSSSLPKNPKVLARFLKAYLTSKFAKRPILPKDLINFKGIICAGTDTAAFKNRIETYFGKKPIELFGGTETATVAFETWAREALTFFPDVNFLEFIPEEDSIKSQFDSTYTPSTVLLNELQPGHKYELVTTKFRGGVFCRYRVGDMIECVSLEDKVYHIKLPQVRYVDRVSRVIDIAGFTRITEEAIERAIKETQMPVTHWVAGKEYIDSEPMLHLVVEVDEDVDLKAFKARFHENLKSIDHDYNDIEALLGRNTLELSVVKPGTFSHYMSVEGHEIYSKINPGRETILGLIRNNG